VRLQRIRKELSDEIDMDIQIMPYILYPHIGPGGVPKSDFAKKTKPGMGRSLRDEAKLEGIEINYKLIDRIPHSLEAHRLVWLINDNELKYNISTQLFHDYFEKGQNIEDHDYLKQIAHDHGIEPASIDLFENKEEGKNDCLAAIEEAKDSYVQLVPTIAFSQDLRIMGLQSPEVLKRYLQRATNLNK
jgi:predicted DsbA family dithiol-disulfide isomerase